MFSVGSLIFAFLRCFYNRYLIVICVQLYQIYIEHGNPNTYNLSSYVRTINILVVFSSFFFFVWVWCRCCVCWMDFVVDLRATLKCFLLAVIIIYCWRHIRAFRSKRQFLWNVNFFSSLLLNNNNVSFSVDKNAICEQISCLMSERETKHGNKYLQEEQPYFNLCDCTYYKCL